LSFLRCSINGENKHYGTPVNPAAPNRVPGGSSSGSAVAVAANCVDFALGQCMQMELRSSLCLKEWDIDILGSIVRLTWFFVVVDDRDGYCGECSSTCGVLWDFRVSSFSCSHFGYWGYSYGGKF
jgi:hypothetical protein